MIRSFSKLTSKQKENLRKELLKIHSEKKCHYCGIPEEKFQKIWGNMFYGRGIRGRTLEFDHKDPNQKTVDLENPDLDNLVFACALCNMAKSNMFYYDEFLKIGAEINKIWQAREKSGRTPVSDSSKSQAKGKK